MLCSPDGEDANAVLDAYIRPNLRLREQRLAIQGQIIRLHMPLKSTDRFKNMIYIKKDTYGAHTTECIYLLDADSRLKCSVTLAQIGHMAVTKKLSSYDTRVSHRLIDQPICIMREYQQFERYE